MGWHSVQLLGSVSLQLRQLEMQDMQKKFMEWRGAGQTRTHVLLWKEYVGTHVKQNVVDLSHVKQGEVQTSHDDMFNSDIVTIVVFGHELTHPPL